MAGVEVISTVNFEQLQRRLDDCERRVFARHERKILDAFKAAWVGWLYQGRPAGAERNVSLKAWKSRIETTTGEVTLYITNGEDYSGYVHRSGSNSIEWQNIWAGIEAQLIPALVADLTAEIEKNLNAPAAPKKLGARGGGTTVTRTVVL